MVMTKSVLRFAILILISVAILIFPLIVRAQTPINCGQTLSASISAAAERDSYTFSASANDGITIRARKTSGTLTPYLELYGPGGGLITSAANKIDRTLTETGIYRIDVRDQNRTNTGDYVLYWERMNNPCSVAANLACEQVVSGSIGTGMDPPPWRIYTFTASANDVVTIRVRKTSGTSFNPQMELYNPSGVYVIAGSQIDRTLTVAGTYKILLRDYYNAYAGNFTLVWRKVSTPCSSTPINCGQILSGSISGADEIDFYTFTGSANDGITIRARKTSGTLTPYLELYGPGGGRITSAANKIERTLTETGTYKILTRDQNNTNTGDYVLYWERINNPCSVAADLACEQVVAGSIGTAADPPPWRVYTFTASANDAVTIRARKTSGDSSFIPCMELYGPTGSYITYAYGALDRVLMAAGTYKVLIRDFYNTYGGSFTLVWRKVSTPCSSTPISCGQVLTGSITGSDAINFYTFTVSANDGVTIRMRKISGTFTPILEIYNPAGSYVTGGSSKIDRTFRTAGTYKILVRDQNYVNTGDYLLYWERMNNPCNVAANLACNQGVGGSIGTGIDPSPWRVYIFTASANDRVIINAWKTSGGTFIPCIELYGPAGDYITFAYNYPYDRVLTTSGTYKVLMRDYYNPYGGDFALAWQNVNTPCNATPLYCGQLLSRSLSPAGKIDAFTFTAAAGDNIVLTLTKISGGLDPSLELYGSSGRRIAYQYTTSGNQVTITQTLSAGGSYSVFVSDYQLDETGDYRLKFQKNNNSCPEVIVIIPNGGERIVARSTFTIRWSSTDLQGISSQEIRLSTDGGQTFPTVIASGLQGSVQNYDWDVPAELVTNEGRIRVTATDTSGISTPDDSDNDFTVFQGVGRQYIYDELNRLRQVIYEDGRRVIYTYDAAGNRITLTSE